MCSSEITVRTHGGLFEQIISMLLFRIRSFADYLGSDINVSFLNFSAVCK